MKGGEHLSQNLEKDIDLLDKLLASMKEILPTTQRALSLTSKRE